MPVPDPLQTLRILLSDLTIAAILGERAETAEDRRTAAAHAQQVLSLRQQIVDLFHGTPRG